MPLYEYECNQCGHHFEAITPKYSDPPPAACPKCGGPVHKMQSAPAFHLKGTGWYVTDYAKKDQAKADSAKEESTAGKKDAGGEKADAAPKAEKPPGKNDKSEKPAEKSDKSDKSEKTSTRDASPAVKKE